MTSLDELLKTYDALPHLSKPQESPEHMTPGEFLRTAHQIMEELPSNTFLEDLKPYWGDLRKALSAITGEGEGEDIGWRLRFIIPCKPLPSEIEERVALFMTDARERLLCLIAQEHDQKGGNGERKFLHYAIRFASRIEQNPRLITEANLGDITTLSDAACEYSR